MVFLDATCWVHPCLLRGQNLLEHAKLTHFCPRFGGIIDTSLGAIKEKMRFATTDVLVDIRNSPPRRRPSLSFSLHLFYADVSTRLSFIGIFSAYYRRRDQNWGETSLSDDRRPWTKIQIFNFGILDPSEVRACVGSRIFLEVEGRERTFTASI